MCNGIRDGFDTMDTNADLSTFGCRKNFSARSQPAIVKDLIDKECEKGFLSGPYKISPFKIYRVSLLGLAEGKYDIESAFKQLGIRRDQWHFCIKWDNKYYFFNRLAFGCRSSPIAICWIATNVFKVEFIFHLLDDFLTIDRPDSCAERTMPLMTTLFKRLNIPLAKYKVVGPCTIIEYLGIILDTENMEAQLPQEKVIRICNFINQFLNRNVCSKRELL